MSEKNVVTHVIVHNGLGSMRISTLPVNKHTNERSLSSANGVVQSSLDLQKIQDAAHSQNCYSHIRLLPKKTYIYGKATVCPT